MLANKSKNNMVLANTGTKTVFHANANVENVVQSKGFKKATGEGMAITSGNPGSNVNSFFGQNMNWNIPNPFTSIEATQTSISMQNTGTSTSAAPASTTTGITGSAATVAPATTLSAVVTGVENTNYMVMAVIFGAGLLAGFILFK